MPEPTVSAAGRLAAWLGGGAFVVALATGAWTFVVTLATPGAPPVALAPAIAWNVFGFSVFALHHSALARSPARAWVARHTGPALERSAYVWIASLLFLAVCLAWQRVPGVLYEASGGWRVLLLAAQALGVALTVGGARVLDVLDLAGIRQVARAPRPIVIRVVWPFTWVRHPLYLGWALMVGAAAPMTVDRAVWALVSTLYLVIAIPWEERSLSAAAGPAYSAYCRQVRWRMVPGLY